MIENKLICYVCIREIRNTESHVTVGINFEKLKLYRHEKCKPSDLSSRELKERKYWTKNTNTIIEKDKRRKSRQQEKIDLKKENL